MNDALSVILCAGEPTGVGVAEIGFILMSVTIGVDRNLRQLQRRLGGTA